MYAGTAATAEEIAVFDVFFRQNGIITYSLACGLEQAVDYILNLKFDSEELKYLKSCYKNIKTL